METATYDIFQMRAGQSVKVGDEKKTFTAELAWQHANMLTKC